MKINHCQININNIHEILHDELTENELFMANPEHEYEIRKILKKIIDNVAKISKLYTTPNENYEAMTKFISDDFENNKPVKGFFFDTVYSEMNEQCFYEIVFNGLDSESETDLEILNHLATLINMEQMPIYGACCIIKCSNDKTPQQINISDIYEIFSNLYFHKGVMTDSNSFFTNTNNKITINNTITIPFVGINVEQKLGNGFHFLDNILFLGLNLTLYGDNSKEENMIISKLLQKKMCGKIFITILNPISAKYYANFTDNVLLKLLTVMENGNYNEINSNIIDNSGINPYLLLA